MNLRSVRQKVQETDIGGGYHIWHCENMSKQHSTRILTWILYLNDIEDGGESEWLYLSKRTSPKQGKLVLWPAGFTHTHRGNPPLKDTKYILTAKSISSIDIKIIITYFLFKKIPITPIVKIIAARNK